jgi:solute carrier family 50 protein (sugar transporter)
MLTIIFPIIGVILTNLIGLNILKTYIDNRLQIKKEYNEVLFYIVFFNSISWLFYGIFIKNIFITLSTTCSLISSFFLIQLLYKNMKFEKIIYIESISSFFIIYFFLLLIIINYSNINENLIQHILGSTAVTTSILYNLSPMLIIREVILTKNNSLIYLPQALIGFVNLVCWFIYGLMINNIYQLITNGICAIICFIQIIIYYYYYQY